jgi:bifunctional non-homologous end joining protein LigD
MLAKLTEEPFDNKEWVFEIKYDGYRALAACDGQGNTELYSRNLLSFNKDFAPVVANLEKMSHQCLLDGEVVAEDAKGRSHFQLLQNYQNTKTGDLKYYVFDLLSLDGNDITGLPLVERKELLKLLLKREKLKNVFYSDHIEEKGTAFFKAAEKKGLEGIIAKNGQSTYEVERRSSQWLKIKISKEQEAVIAGFTAPQGARNHFGSLVLGVYNGNQFEYIGNCGTGFDEVTLAELYRKFKHLFTAVSPFKERIALRGKVQWLKPKLVCQVKFSEWTSDGSMRHPVFLGLRKDKKATEVKREIPDEMKSSKTKTKKAAVASDDDAEKSKGDFEKKIGKVTLKLTNQQKIYWPDEGITKGELVNYYDEISSFILPYLKDRPQSQHRFPNGIRDAGFYQKDVDTAKIPQWLQTEKVYSDSNKEYIDYLICNDKATLIYMANLGCIEINPWNSRIQKPENPDWLVVDLDPEDISFKEVVRAALETKKMFDELEIDCYCKTSGATGLHIFVPLGAKYDYDIAKEFTHLVVQRVNELLPKTTSILRMPAKRKKKVYLDFLQNRRGQTLAAPYSVRPKPGATVSTPLKWEEVNDKLDPTKFTIKTIFKRLDKVGDLWKPVLGKGANLDKAIKQVYEAG